jgi:hypothetical protein
MRNTTATAAHCCLLPQLAGPMAFYSFLACNGAAWFDIAAVSATMAGYFFQISFIFDSARRLFIACARRRIPCHPILLISHSETSHANLHANGRFQWILCQMEGCEIIHLLCVTSRRSHERKRKRKRKRKHKHKHKTKTQTMVGGRLVT